MLKNTVIVFLFHIFFLCLLLFSKDSVGGDENNKKISVKTIVLKETPVVEKKVKPVVVKKEPVKKIVTKSSRKEKVVSKALLSKLEKSISEMDNVLEEVALKSYKKELLVPKVSLDMSSPEKNRLKKGNQNFEKKLIEHFKKNLLLPEYGGVKLKLKIERSGIVKDVVVLFSQNKDNEKLLKNALLSLSVPWLNQYVQEDEIDLIIHFTNDI